MTADHGTIFGKIDRAAVFLSDLTYVVERAGGGRPPNPNVCHRGKGLIIVRLSPVCVPRSR